ncbi:MAG TPA: alpha-amylase family glycosyl hydrolase, partial [Blastocatellia bacterium]|nr:alpha-amylase family glycosyl hydrolase [Blastocatellia bacterium]
MNHTVMISRLFEHLRSVVFVSCFLLVCLAPASFAQSAPEVTRVEPPSWWAGHSINPIRLLVRGRNLRGSTVRAGGSGISVVSAPAINEAGTYLLVDVSIDPAANPGRRTLQITAGGRTIDATFEIATPLDPAGRFQGFSPDDVIYLLMPDRYCDGDASNNDPSESRGMYDRAKSRYYHGGDFRGIINRLPYLKSLGITAIWLNPIYDNVNHLNTREQYDDGPGTQKSPITDYHGYGAVDFYGVEEHFGTAAELRRLVDAAHRLGIKVIQDQVANHTGPFHPWVKDSPTPTWYHGTEAEHLDETWQTWTLTDPNSNVAMRRATLEGWFINILPDLNQSDSEAARYIIQNTLWWLGTFGFDGIRQDTLPYVDRRFWQEWMTAIRRQYPNVNVVGEVYDADPGLVSFFQGGRPRFDGIDSRIDTLFDFPLLYPIRRAFAEGKPVRELATMLAHDNLYPNPRSLVTFIGNHDMLRFMNERGATIAGLKLAQTFILTTRGIPQLYYGDEIAMKGGGDPDNRRDFPGGFPGDRRDAFAESGRTAEEREVFEHVRRLTRLRLEIEPLRRGELINLYVADQQYAYARRTGAATAIVVINNDSRDATVEFEVGELGLRDGATATDRLAAS